MVVVGGAWLLLRTPKRDGITLETAETCRITIRNSVMATGTVEPVTEVDVGTQVSGIIDKLYVDYNDVVYAGQLIAEMDKVTLEAELKQSEAELASSKTEYEYQTKNYARTRTLHEKELVSDAEYDEAFYQYEKIAQRLRTGPGCHRQGKAESGLCDHHLAHRRRGHQPGRGGGTNRGGQLRDPDALHHRAGPDTDAGRGRCGRGRHRAGPGRTARGIHG